MTKVWIDTTSGTWGTASAFTPVLVDVTDEQLDALDEMTDSEVNEFGIKFGRTVAP